MDRLTKTPWEDIAISATFYDADRVPIAGLSSPSSEVRDSDGDVIVSSMTSEPATIEASTVTAYVKGGTKGKRYTVGIRCEKGLRRYEKLVLLEIV